MRALIFDGFGEMHFITDLSIPIVARSDQAVIKVEATGFCRSDWHSWMRPEVRELLLLIPE